MPSEAQERSVHWWAAPLLAQEEQTAFWHEIADENSKLARVVAWTIALTMVLFVGIEFLTLSHDAAQSAYPWLLAARIAAIVLSAAFLALESSGVGQNVHIRLWGQTIYLAGLMASVGILLGLYEWFQPTAGYFVAAIFLVAVAFKLRPGKMVVILAAGCIGIILPAVIAPGATLATVTPKAINVALMSVASLGIAALSYRRAAVAFLDRRTIARQTDDLVTANRQLTTALAQAREAREAAMSAEQAKGQLLAKISHEVRNPLQGIIGATEQLREQTSDPGTLALQQVIADGAEGALAIVSESLEFSRADAGAIPLEARRYDPLGLLRSLAALFGRVADDRSLRIEVLCDDPPQVQLGDPYRVRQIITNLLHNALKFSEPGGLITLSTTATGGSDRFLRYVVTDNGVGVRSDRLEAIFSPFEQADSSVTRNFGGSGLGLAIARRVAEAMGGTLTARSEEGKGSEFVLLLPLAAADAPDGPEASVDGPDSGLRILLAEDNPINQQVISAMVGSLGYACVVVGTGTEALAVSAEQRFDAILLDLEMPEMGGIEALEVIRARPGRRIPVAVLTAHTEAVLREEARQAGADGFLPKPFTLPELRTLMTALVPPDAAGESSVALAR